MLEDPENFERANPEIEEAQESAVEPRTPVKSSALNPEVLQASEEKATRLEAELEEMRGKKTNLKKRLKKEKDAVEQLSRELAEREKGFDATKQEFLLRLQAAQQQLDGR